MKSKNERIADLEKDKRGGLFRTHQNSVKIVKEFCEKFDLIAVRRVIHPESSKYTWRKRHPSIHSRLDFFLTCQSVVNNVTNADTNPGYKTDHSMITLNFSLHSNSRGPGFWKLNTSFLTEIDYVNQIKSVIQGNAERV